MARIKVLISGAGIAGNALAFWLSRLGHDVTVVERFPTLRTTGLQIDLRGHGIEVLKRMGLEQAFRAKSAPEQGLQVVDKTGRRRGYFPANRSGKGLQSFTTDYEIMRGDMCQLLYDASKARTKFIFGTSVDSYEEKDNAVEVRFTDGKTDRFDLLVGADGVHSRMRKMMVGSDASHGFYPLDGLYVGYFTTPRPIKKGEEYISTMYMASGGRGVMTRRSNPDTIQVYLGGRSNSERLKNAARGDVKEEKAAITEVLKGAGWEVDDLLKSLVDADDFYFERLGLVKLDSWSRGRVVLVGDAAYCPTVNTGMGTTSSMVGAYILAGELAKYCGRGDTESSQEGHGIMETSLLAALKAYEQKYQPFMTKVQKGVLEDKGVFMDSAFGVAMANWFLGVASFLRIDIAKYFIKEDIRGWDLPTYEELLRG